MFINRIVVWFVNNKIFSTTDDELCLKDFIVLYILFCVYKTIIHFSMDDDEKKNICWSYKLLLFLFFLMFVVCKHYGKRLVRLAYYSIIKVVYYYFRMSLSIIINIFTRMFVLSDSEEINDQECIHV